MKLNLKPWVIALGTVLSVAATQAEATTVGIFGDQTAAASSVAGGLGYSTSVLGDLSAASLAGVDVLWVLNGNNGGHSAQFTTNAAALSSFVSGGGVFVYNDRAVTGASSVLPGGAGISIFRDFTDDANINVVAGSGLLSGPGGVINNATLDGGSSSSHGYALLGTLPAGANIHLTQTDISHITDFDFEFGDGDVYYSTIPLDYYFGGGPVAAFSSVYAPNLISYAVGLAAANDDNNVPEPTSALLVGVGLFALAARRRMN